MTCEQAQVDYRARWVEYEVEYLRADRDVWHAGSSRRGPKQGALRVGRDLGITMSRPPQGCGNGVTRDGV